MKILFKTVLVVCVFALSTTSVLAQQNSKDFNTKQLEGVFRAAVYQDCSVSGKIDVEVIVRKHYHGRNIVYFYASQNGRSILRLKRLLKAGQKLKPSDFNLRCRIR